jgi:membrane-bound metal-dependent hydrolase YbcI (DUF457 family)
MHTQTHIIMGAALFGRTVPRRAGLAALGGLLPDLPMLLMVLGLKSYGIPDPIIFGVLYWQEWWQVTNAISHNVWIWGGLLVLAIVLHERRAAAAIDRASLLGVFSASALLHVAIDFLCHREDAHMSLWPLTRWKFFSPVSYYDPAHFGTYVSIFEAVLGLAMAALLFSRFRNRWTRTTLGLAMVLYLAVPAYFIFT